MLLKKSFVIHLCCLKKYNVREINNFPKRYKCSKFKFLHTKPYFYIHLHTKPYFYIHLHTKPYFYIQNLIFTYIFIIMSCRLHGYPWPSLATSPYRSSPPAGLLGYILYPHIAAVCMFELVVLLLLGRMWGSIGVNHLWARLCFSSSVLCVWFI